MVSLIPPADLVHLVAHRGFHSPLDRSDRRPLENSLAAYEEAWASGISLCECDVMLTRDGVLVLVCTVQACSASCWPCAARCCACIQAHDTSYARLALIPDSPSSTCKVGELTLQQLIKLQVATHVFDDPEHPGGRRTRYAGC